MKSRRTSLSISMTEDFAKEVKSFVTERHMKISDFVVNAIKSAMKTNRK